MEERKNLVVKNIKKVRTDLLDKKVIEIAKLIRVKESTIRCYENELEIIPLKHLITIANEYGLSLDYLFGLKSYNVRYTKIDTTSDNFDFLGENIRSKRKNKGLTLNKVAEDTRISRTSLSNYERGKNLIKTLYLSILVKYLDIDSIDKLFNRKEIK